MYDAIVERSSSALAAFALSVWEDEGGAPARSDFLRPELPLRPPLTN